MTRKAHIKHTHAIIARRYLSVLFHVLFQRTWLSTAHLATAVPFCMIIAFAVSNNAKDSITKVLNKYLCIIAA